MSEAFNENPPSVLERLRRILLALPFVVAVCTGILAVIAFITSILAGKLEWAASDLLADLSAWALVTCVAAVLLTVIQFKMGHRPFREWLRLIGLVASSFVALSPLAILWRHDIGIGFALYEESLPCAVCFALSGAIAFAAWWRRKKLIQILTVPVLAVLFLWILNVHQSRQRTVEAAAERGDGFAVWVSEYGSTGRGWFTLGGALATLAIATLLNALPPRKESVQDSHLGPAD